ncbi:MAG TPA: phosphotransferase [Mycobacteriales bacterium]|nr:phosphotransferase [Mycobacteriales bacterium]
MTELVAQIAAAFGLAEPTAHTDLSAGWTTNLRLEVPGRGSLIARVHTRTPADRLAAIQHARRVVAAAGIPALPPISPPDFVQLAGGSLVELEPYIEWNAKMNTVPLLEKGFGVLARTHDALRKSAIPDAGRTAPRANHIAAEDAAEATRRGAARMRGWGDPVLSRFADRVERHIDAVSAAELPLQPAQLRQLGHGDFWDDNVLFRDGELVALLDFDFLAERPRIDDLALTLYFFLLEPGRALPTAADRAQVRRFVAAYDAATDRPLSAAERAALPLAIARQPAWSVGRWIVGLDEPEAREHAADAIGELPVAQAILAELPQWQDALS